MEWYEILNTCTSILILCTFVSVFIIVTFVGPFIVNKNADQENEKTKEKEPKQTTKVVVFDSQRNLTHWFDAIGVRLVNMNVKCDIYRGLRRIEIGNTKIYFMTNYEANENWFTLPKDTLYYLTADNDLDANFDKAFYQIMFTKEGYYDIDGIRGVLHL